MAVCIRALGGSGGRSFPCTGKKNGKERVETNQRKVLSPSTEVSAKCQWIQANWRFIRFIMGCLDITEMYPCGCTSHEVIAFSVETYKVVIVMSGSRNERSISIMNLHWDNNTLGINSQFEILICFMFPGR